MEPGEGAIEYARSLVNGLNREQAAIVLRKRPDDPRVKCCSCCGYHFRDQTRPGNAKTCGESCKRAVKTWQRHIQRGKDWSAKPKKKILYYDWFEYPFWINERAMLYHAWSYDSPKDPDKINQILAARQRCERFGGKRKPIRRVEY
ncbi:hypothetical protein [Cohnella sp.]|uniref:hypothetical protein n=1 Tax=Cohnella sp. TaxID=1883426 RepID=UPI003563B553